MAVLGPTNTGKTHLAIERLCAHSSGAIGFPLRLLAREVYEKVCAIKGRERVALITGEERIEPPGARWLLCTAEAMPARADLAFMALDEVQLCADRERGHVFTDRLLNMRGREETMLLGSSVMEPMVKALVPEAEIISRPRFSTLSHAGAKKLSRIPPRSVIVAFSAEQVYAVAEMLRRFRGGAAVVMGALSPETRNKQVALYQAGEVDYLVATDAIGMGLNLDVGHVAFAGLSKFDGVRQRRLTPTEMAQIAGRAGRHQRDGTFGTLAGSGGHDAEFGEDEVFAIEEHRFAPLTRLFWREAEPRFDTLARLIADLEAPPLLPELAPAPQAIDLAVLKILAEDPAIARGLQLPGQIRRFWHVCSLPDFRNQGAETHARFVARLWEELSRGTLASDHAPRAISALDNTAGDIDTLQGRIAAIRSWAYICQRPDWVLNRSEMAERARGVEARLSDALHGRLTERFVNRRTTVLMRRLGPDAALLPVLLEGEDVLVEGEKLGSLRGFRFRVDPVARLADQKLLLAAAEKHLPQLLAVRAQELIAALKQPAGRRGAKQGDRGQGEVALAPGAVLWRGEPIARLEAPRGGIRPQPRLDPALERVPPAEREALAQALAAWLGRKLGPLAPLARLEEASRAEESGPELRALLIRLVEAGGVIARAGSGVDRLDKGRREGLRRLGVKVGALDLFVPAMVQPAALRLWAMLAGRDGPPPGHAAVLEAAAGTVPFGYRRCARQWLRVDVAEGLLRGAHALRMAAGQRAFVIDPEPALAQGITTAALAHLLREAGFRASSARRLAPDEHGPAAPPRWRWAPPQGRQDRPAPPPADAAARAQAEGNPFGVLARLVA